MKSGDRGLGSSLATLPKGSLRADVTVSSACCGMDGCFVVGAGIVRVTVGTAGAASGMSGVSGRCAVPLATFAGRSRAASLGGTSRASFSGSTAGLAAAGSPAWRFATVAPLVGFVTGGTSLVSGVSGFVATDGFGSDSGAGPLAPDGTVGSTFARSSCGAALGLGGSAFSMSRAMSDCDSFGGDVEGLAGATNAVSGTSSRGATSLCSRAGFVGSGCAATSGSACGLAVACP
jgi:hypothetical protein